MTVVEKITCSHCGGVIETIKKPSITVDIIIEVPTSDGQTGVVLIERKNYPFGWAIPGGFVDYGESVEAAAVREAREETSLDVRLQRLLGVYSDPGRDPRGHTISVVFVAEGRGKLKGRDDARAARIFTRNALPKDLAFDHEKILHDYFATVQ